MYRPFNRDPVHKWDFCIFTLNVKKRSFVMSVMIYRSQGEKYREDGFWRMCLCNKCAENPFMNAESSWSGILHFLIQYLHFHNGRKHFNTCSVRQQNYQRPNMKCNFFQITLIDSLSQKFTNQSRSQDALTPFGKIRANKNFVVVKVFCLNWWNERFESMITMSIWILPFCFILSGKRTFSIFRLSVGVGSFYSFISKDPNCK